MKEYYSKITLGIDLLPWLQQDLAGTLSTRHVTPRESRKSLVFTSREQCGHSMKSSLSQTLRIDTRNDTVLPTKGFLLKWISEITGPLGDSAFTKNDFLGSFYLPITQTVSLSLSCFASIFKPLFSSSPRDAFSPSTLLVQDSLVFKNPLQCRGWNHSVCGSTDFPIPRENRLLAIASSLKLNFQVPLLRGAKSSWLLNNTQMHVFCDYGAVGSSHSATSMWQFADWTKFSSLTTGIGLAVKLGQYGRAELNYCHPLVSGASKAGLQVGIGVDIL